MARKITQTTPKQYFSPGVLTGWNEVSVSSYNPKSKKNRNLRTSAYLLKRGNKDRWVWKGRAYTPSEMAKRLNLWIQNNQKNADTEILIKLKLQKFYSQTGEWDTAKSKAFIIRNSILRRLT